MTDDRIARGIVGDGVARVVAVVATEVAREAARRHAANGVAAVAMGRAATAGLLLATLTKGDEQVTLQLLGNGPLGTLTVDASGDGTARVFVTRPQVAPFVSGDRRPKLGDAVGRTGIVSVVRDLGLGGDFRGQTAIVDGEIDTDVERYLSDSEQIDSALACETVLDDAGRVHAAVGVLVQSLPGGAGADLVAEARRRLRAGALGDRIAPEPSTGEITPVALLRAALGDDATVLMLDERPVRFHCPCSRERASATLALLGDTDLVTIMREDGKAEVVCEFCRARYDFTDADLEMIRRGARGSNEPAS